jgi:hypothetical protein
MEYTSTQDCYIIPPFYQSKNNNTPFYDTDLLTNDTMMKHAAIRLVCEIFQFKK